MEAILIVLGVLVLLVVLTGRRHHEPTVIVVTNPDDLYRNRGLGCGFEIFLIMVIAILALILFGSAGM